MSLKKKIKDRGTPKTLEEAIQNAFDEWLDTFVSHLGSESVQRKLVKDHVRDFAAQKFTVAILKARKTPYTDHDLHLLFKGIFGDK